MVEIPSEDKAVAAAIHYPTGETQHSFASSSSAFSASSGSSFVIFHDPVQEELTRVVHGGPPSSGYPFAVELRELPTRPLLPLPLLLLTSPPFAEDDAALTSSVESRNGCGSLRPSRSHSS